MFYSTNYLASYNNYCYNRQCLYKLYTKLFITFIFYQFSDRTDTKCYMFILVLVWCISIREFKFYFILLWKVNFCICLTLCVMILIFLYLSLSTNVKRLSKSLVRYIWFIRRNVSNERYIKRIRFIWLAPKLNKWTLYLSSNFSFLLLKPLEFDKFELID